MSLLHKISQHFRIYHEDNFESLVSHYKEKYSKQFPLKYQSCLCGSLSLFDYVSLEFLENINSDYSIYNDLGIIDYRVKYFHSKEISIHKDLYSHYYGLSFSGAEVPIYLRELVVNKNELLEEFYRNLLKRYIKLFYMRGHVDLFWIKMNMLCEKGFNPYVNSIQTSLGFRGESIEDLILYHERGGMFNTDNRYSVVSNYIDKKGIHHDIGMISFDWSESRDFMSFNLLVSDLEITPSTYLGSTELVNQYLDELNKPINTLRNRLNLPNIGEGWISETKLYYQLKEYFSNTIVLQHQRPKWLGRQHFDIYFQKENIAIEYQGKQHYEEVSIFGGSEGLKKSQIRDKRKKKLCLENDCILIEVFPNYDFNEVLKELKSAILKNG